MQAAIVLRILGILLMVFSLAMLPPALVSLWYQDGEAQAFVSAFGIILLLGTAIWTPVRGRVGEMRVRDGFMVVGMLWAGACLVGAIPFMLSTRPHMALADAVFEAVSGLTTTGATVLLGLDTLPPSILFYRAELHWLGGMGIIVLAVAVLPMLGIGGMQLFRAETSGPIKDSKLTPRIKETAKLLWFVYLGLTGACLLAYWAAGMTFFDALLHAVSTISTGGFSSHDASIGYFNSPLIEAITLFFMILGGANFTLHFLAWHRSSPLLYWRDAEFRVFIAVLLTVSLLTSYYLYRQGVYADPLEALRHGSFQAVSIITTTGYTTADIAVWPGFAGILLILASFIGGCAGSTSGGIKVIRFQLLVKQGMREIRKVIHPNADIPIRIGHTRIETRVIGAVWGFFALYVASFTVMYLALAFLGIDLITAFSAVAAMMNNMGPGLGTVSATCAHLEPAAKWILSFAMLLGRLEVFTLLVLLTPAYWRW
jgi:trk system potassium uptake protein